jgi:hypothetical protein
MGQRFRGVVSRFCLVPSRQLIQPQRPSSNPAPTLNNHIFSNEIEGFEATQATHSRDSPGGQGSAPDDAAPAGMDRQESQSNGPEMQITLRKPGFSSGKDRTRTTREILGKIRGSKTRRRRIRRAPRNRECTGSALGNARVTDSRSKETR